MNETGCEHGCHVDAEHANRIVFVEQWADMAAVKVHFAVPASRTFGQAWGAMAVGRPEIHLFEATELPSALS